MRSQWTPFHGRKLADAHHACPPAPPRVEIRTSRVGTARVGSQSRGRDLASQPVLAVPGTDRRARSRSCPPPLRPHPASRGVTRSIRPSACSRGRTTTSPSPDPSTDTGRRLNLNPLAMPRNIAGNPIRPEEWNRNDGFSPGQKITTKVPGLDTQAAFDRTGAVPITDIERTYDPGQAVVVLNADTGRRHLIWSEMDANPADPADVNLIIRPAVNFDEGGHYIVALRNLKRANGKVIKAQQPFRVYRDRLKSSDPAVEARRPAHGAAVRDAPARRHRAQQPLPRLGLHGRQRAQPLRARALDPRRRVRGARRHRPRRHAGAGLGAAVHGLAGDRLHRLPRTRRSPARWTAPSSCRAT